VDIARPDATGWERYQRLEPLVKPQRHMRAVPARRNILGLLVERMPVIEQNAITAEQ
jgi:hypothetical protein